VAVHAIDALLVDELGSTFLGYLLLILKSPYILYFGGLN